jgi:3-methylfumaryl-CoA hydratase
MLRLALGRPDPEFRDGDALPPAWLALYFLPRVAADALRPDGSPKDTGVVPPMAMPRRMFAGRARAPPGPRCASARACGARRGWPTSPVKHGGTGTLVFATVTSRIEGPHGLAVEEERRTVFREEVKAGERNQAPRRDPAPTDVPWASCRDAGPGRALPLLGAHVQQPPDPL